ncbi:hypothetical protein AAC387_Pa09g0724 [Persea americana]
MVFILEEEMWLGQCLEMRVTTCHVSSFRHWWVLKWQPTEAMAEEMWRQREVDGGGGGPLGNGDRVA